MNKERCAADRVEGVVEALERYIEESGEKDHLLLEDGEWQPGPSAIIVKAMIRGIWLDFLPERISGDVEFTVDGKDDPDAILVIMRKYADAFRLIEEWETVVGAEPRPTGKGLYHRDSRRAANRLMVSVSIATRKATWLQTVHGKARGQMWPQGRERLGWCEKHADRRPSGRDRRSANLGQMADQRVWGLSQQCSRESLPKLGRPRLRGPRSRNKGTVLWKGISRLPWDRRTQIWCTFIKTYTTLR